LLALAVEAGRLDEVIDVLGAARPGECLGIGRLAGGRFRRRLDRLARRLLLGLGLVELGHLRHGIGSLLRVMSVRQTVSCEPASGTMASAEASMVRAARSSGSRLCTLVLPQARAIIWHSMARQCRKL